MTERAIFQGVHMLIEGKFDRASKKQGPPEQSGLYQSKPQARFYQ